MRAGRLFPLVLAVFLSAHALARGDAPAASGESPDPDATPEPQPVASPTPIDPHAHFGSFPEEVPPQPHAEVFSGVGETVLGIPLSREGSGTAWQPDTTPMHGWHASLGAWSLMFHGNLYAGYLQQNAPGEPGDRGGDAIASMNHLMAMARRELGGGDFALRAMLSAEPATIEARGYPLTLQTGETYRDEPIHDRQHPHDLFMELAATFTVPIADDLGLQLYAAPAGEPALGPVAFPHRVSAQANPLATLAHHWQDSTHVAFGVATIGLFSRRWKVEGSAFNGREPDEKRLDIEFPGIDSYSGRVTLMPMKELAIQASYGFLRSPEEHDPDVSVRRWTASMIYARPLGEGGRVSTSLIFGRNDEGAALGSTDGVTLEGEVSGDGRSSFFLRAENVRKRGDELALPYPALRETYDVTSFTLGYLHELPAMAGVQTSLGVLGTQAFVGTVLEPLYGTGSPRGYMLYLRLRPGSSHHGMQHPHH